MSYRHKEAVAKPFLKWAGGKTQLLSTFDKYYPEELLNGGIKRYIEPFVGSGAVLFHIMQNFKIESAYITDINYDLINAYKVVKHNANNLIDYLKELEINFLRLPDEQRKVFYYTIRDAYNQGKAGFCYRKNSKQTIKRAAQFIFLNKTCFNGLYRVNKDGLYNVPMGSYKNPKICDNVNLMAVSDVLQNVHILHSDYKQCKKYINSNSLVYFDPPYRPLNKTASFTSYNEYDFDDSKQIELAQFYREVGQDKQAYLMLSNSNPKNVDKNDTFFEELFEGFNIYNVNARRAINSKGEKRGQIKELVITNYDIYGESRRANEEYQIL